MRTDILNKNGTLWALPSSSSSIFQSGLLDFHTGAQYNHASSKLGALQLRKPQVSYTRHTKHRNHILHTDYE
jgi:hypothetical protein